MNSIMVKALLGVTLALNASNNARRQQEKQTNSSGNDWDKLWDELNKPFCENNKPPYPPPYDFCCDNKEMFSDDYQPLFLNKKHHESCKSTFNSLHKMDGEQKFSDLLWESYGNVRDVIKACNDQFGNIFKNATCYELNKIANLKNDAKNYEFFEESCTIPDYVKDEHKAKHAEEYSGQVSKMKSSLNHLMDFLTAQAKEEKEGRKCSDKVNETASGSGKIDTSDTHSGNFFDNIDFVTIGVIVIAVIAAVIAVSGLAYCCFYCTNGKGDDSNGQGDNPNGTNGTNGTNEIIIEGDANQIVMGENGEKSENENRENTCLTSLFGYCTFSGQGDKSTGNSNKDNNNKDDNVTKNKAVQ